MDAAITAAVGLGSALLGVAGGFWGAVHLERRREARRRRGLIAAFSTDLSENAVTSKLLLKELEEKPEAAGPLWDAGGPPSADFWRAHIADLGSFLPFDLLFKMRMAYGALAFVRDVGDQPESWADRAKATRIVKHSVALLQEAAGDIVELPEGKAIRSKMQAARDFAEEQKARLRDA